MNTEQISTIVEAHTCSIDGVSYRFSVVSAATEQSEDTANARILLHVQVTEGDAAGGRMVGRLNVLTPMHKAAEIPSLLTDALRECLSRSGLERLVASGRPPRPIHVPELTLAFANTVERPDNLRTN